MPRHGWVASQLSLIDTLGTPADVGTAGPQTIRLGSLDGTIAATGTLTIAGSIALTNSASTLGLYAQGNITETAGGGISIGGPGAGAGAAVEVGTITGSAGGSVALVGTLGETSFTPATAAAVTPANHFDVLGPFSATGGLYVADSPDANAGLAGLTVQGTIANTGSGGIGLLDAASPAHVGGVIALGTASVGGDVHGPGPDRDAGGAERCGRDRCDHRGGGQRDQRRKCRDPDRACQHDRRQRLLLRCAAAAVGQRHRHGSASSSSAAAGQPRSRRRAASRWSTASHSMLPARSRPRASRSRRRASWCPALSARAWWAAPAATSP